MGRNGLIKAVWGISKQLGIDKEELYILLGRETGKSGIRACSNDELQKLLKALDFFKQKDALQHGGKRLSEAQKKYIHDLAANLGWKAEPHRLQAFVKRNTGVENVSWLSPRQASNIIEGLKNMLTRRDVETELEAEAASAGAETGG